MAGVITAAAVLAVIAAVLFIPVRLTALVSLDERELVLRYAFLRFTVYPRSEKTKKHKKEEKQDREQPQKEGIKSGDVLRLLKFLKESKDDIKAVLSRTSEYMLKHAVKIRELNVSARFGTGDPAYTGMLCGAVYTAVYSAIGYAVRHMRLKKWSAELTPDFNRAYLSAGMYVQLSTNIFHGIALGAVSFKYIMRIIKRFLKSRQKSVTGKEKENG